MTGGCVST